MPPRTKPRTLIPGNKNAALEPERVRLEGATLTSDQGVPIHATDDSLKLGPRGPTLLEDFHLREKITRFDHERIPERVVHARGSAAHGFFQPYESHASLTKAKFLQDPKVKTPVFVRFSTVGGSRGSADTVRDVRGFAVKFYTEEGNFDLVGNNIPVFFIQDGIKFPDIVHAVKPEPHHEMPQASSAHDSFWDFVSLVPESAHMVMWLMSDRAIPRSYRHMEGFGVHTFRFVDAKGKSSFVKFHWKPLLGMASLVWDEAQKINGKDPDFHRRDLWESIEAGAFPQYELGVQVVTEADARKLGIDLFDPTKLVPEEAVPVRPLGKMTLDRNPDNFFAETEQVAYCVANVVPGIDFTNDPLMQARLFSYQDTQLTRLGGPNFAEIPINQPIVPVTNHQQDGFKRHAIPASRANYHPNSLGPDSPNKRSPTAPSSAGSGCPFLAGATEGFMHFPEPHAAAKARARPESFGDHFSQARLFLASQSPPERQHLVDACCFEVSKVERKEVRERVINELFAKIDPELAILVARAVGAPIRKTTPLAGKARVSPALSIEVNKKPSIKTRQIAILVADGANGEQVAELVAAATKGGAMVHLVSTGLGPVKGIDGMEADRTFLNASSVLFDAVYVPGGKASIAKLLAIGEVLAFLEEAYRHYKPIGATSEGVTVVQAAITRGAKPATAAGVILSPDGSRFVRPFLAAVAAHRHWGRVGYPK